MNRLQALTSCLDDAQILAMAVGDDSECDPDARAHLRSCASCGRRVTETRSDIAPLRAPARDEPKDQSLFKPLPLRRDAPPPTKIGRYEIVEELGRGGQASVYLARHPTLKTDVVLKVGHFPLRPPTAGESDTTPEDDDYLVREGRLLKKLHHPNLAQVHDLEYVVDERTGERKPVLVIEHVRGRPLRDVAKERKFSAREAALLISKVARAAAAAHAVGVFHRDITPANIMIDEAGEPRLIDFGLARYRHAWGERFEPIGPEYGSGTRGYRAPEQADGRNDDIDARTDVYGLGAVLQHLLLRGASSIKAPATNGTGDEVFGPDLSRLRSSRAGSRIIRIAEHAMQVDAGKRYESASAMAAELERAAHPSLWPRYLASAAALAAVILIAVSLRPTAPVIPVGPQPVLVPKDNLPLEDALPFNENVRASLRVNVPRDATAALLQIDPTGEIEVHDDLVRVRSNASSFDAMEYWPGGFQFGSRAGSKFVPDPRGVKFFLVVVLRGKRVDPAEIRQLSNSLRTVVSPGWLPEFDSDTHAYARLWPDDVDDVHGKLDRSTTVPPASRSLGAVNAQLQRVRNALLSGGWTIFAGVAVPYEPSAQTKLP